MRTPESDIVSQVFFYPARRFFVRRTKYLQLHLFHITVIPPGSSYLFFTRSRMLDPQSQTEYGFCLEPSFLVEMFDCACMTPSSTD